MTSSYNSQDPNVVNQLQAAGVLNFAQPMDTVFVKKVTPESEAHYAGLHEGDRLLAVNGIPVAGKQFADIVGTIQKIPKTLTLQIVPKCYDILQTVSLSLFIIFEQILINWFYFSFLVIPHIIPKQTNDHNNNK